MPRRIKRTAPRARHYIREWRLHRALTQEQLAGRLDTSKTTISRIEAGKQPYTQDVLEALAEALGCGPADLLMRDPTRPSAPWDLADTVRQMTPEDQQRAAAVIMALHSTPKTGTDG